MKTSLYSVVLSLAFVVSSAIAQTTVTFSNGDSNSTSHSTDPDGLILTIASGSASWSGSLYGSGDTEKTGAGTLVINTDNSYSGTVTISDGVLSLGNEESLYQAHVVLDGGTLGFTTNSSGYVLRTLSGTGTLNLENTNSAGISLSISDSGQNYAFDGTLTGAGNLYKYGSGTFTLSGANTFTGTTTLSSGTLALTNADALKFSTLSANGGTLDLGTLTTLNLGGLSGSTNFQLQNASSDPLTLTVGYNNQDTTFSGELDGAGSLVKTGTGTLTLNSYYNNYLGSTTINGGTLVIIDYSALGDTPATATPGHLTLDGGTLQAPYSTTIPSNRGILIGENGGGLIGSFTYNGIIAGTGDLTLSGSSSLLRLGGLNTLSGNLNLTEGTLDLTNANALAHATLNFTSGATLSTSDSNITFGGLAGTGDIADLTLTVGSNNHDTTYSGVFSGAGSLTKVGTGSLTLSGTNTYSGGTTVSAGTLAVTADANLGATSGDVAVTSGASLSTGGYFGTNRAITLDGSGTNLYNNGELIIGSSGTGSLSLTNGATVSTYNLDLGFPSGTGTVNISSGSSISANGNNGVVFYSPTSTVNLNETGTITTTGLSGTGNFNLAGGTLRSGAAYTSSTGATLSNASTIDTNGYATTLSGVLTGTGSLTKSGTGTLTLTGANDYSGGTTVSAGTLSGTTTSLQGDITNNATVTFDQAADGTYAGVISGTGALAKSGTGTVTLSGNNTFTGGTTINSGGTLQLGAGSTTGSVAGDITNNGTLVFNRSDDYTFNGVISGTGDVTQDGYILRFSQAQTYTGATTIRGNYALVLSTTVDQGLSASTTVDVGTGAVFDFSNRTLEIAGLSGTGRVYSYNGSDGHLTVNTAADTSFDFSGVLGGGSAYDFAFTKTGDGTQILSGTNNYTGATTISGGTLQLGNGGTTGSITTTTITNNGTLAFNRSDDLTYSGVVTGTGSLTQAGSGTLTLSGANDYSGGTTISAGTLAGDTASLQGDITNNSALVFNQSEDATFSSVISGTGSLTKNGTGDLTLSQGSAASGSLTVSAGTLRIGTGSTAALAASSISNDGSLIINSSSALSANSLSGAGTITKNGSGTLTLSGTNTYTGSTTLNAGTLALGSASALGSTSSVDLASGTTLDLNDHDLTIGDIDGAGHIDLGSATLTAGDANIHALSGIISGTGAFTKSGAGALTLSGANTFSGNTSISAGTLVLDNSLALQNSTLTNTSGLSFGTLTAATLGGLSGSQNLALTNGSSAAVTLTVGSNDASTTYSGILSGAGTLNKTGSGTLTLSNTDSAGNLTVSGGTVSTNRYALTGDFLITGDSSSFSWTGGANPLFRGTFSVTDGGTATFSTTNSAYLASYGAGTINVSGTGSNLSFGGYLNVSDNNTGILNVGSGGTVTVGTLVLANTGSGNGTLNLNAGGTLAFQGSGGSSIQTGNGTTQFNFAGGTFKGNDSTITYVYADTTLAAGTTSVVDTNGQSVSWNNTISGSGALTKSGTGTLYLNAANTFTGDTTISGGTLVLNDANALQNSTLTTATGLNFSTLSAVTLGGLSGSQNLALTNGNSNGVALTVGNNNASTTYTGTLSGAGSLIKTGSGNLTLGYNNHTGGTIINAGTITLGDYGSLGEYAGTLTLNGGTVNLNGFDPSLGTVIFNGGTFINGNLDNVGERQLLAGSLSATLGGSAPVTKLGNGTFILSGTNTYDNSTTISGGTLSIAADSALGTAPSTASTGFLVLNGGTLATTASFELNANRGIDISANSSINTAAGTTLTYAGAIEGGGEFTKDGTGTLSLSGTNNRTGITYVSAGTLEYTDRAAYFGANSDTTYVQGSGTLGLHVGSGNYFSNADVAAIMTPGGGNAAFFSNNGTLELNTSHADSGTFTLSTALVDHDSGDNAVALTKTGTGTLVLTGTNTYTGRTTISGGTLSVSADSGLGNGSNLTINGGTLASTTSFTLNSGRDVALGSSGGTIDTASGTTLTFDGTFSGTGNLTKTGAGTLALGGSFGTFYDDYYWANTGSNAVQLNAGTLTLGSASVLGQSDVTINGGTLDFGTHTSASLGTLSGSGNIVLTNSAATPAAVNLTVGGNDRSSTFSGAISGNGSLTKTGTGTLTLSGSNSYSGDTVVSGGTLALTSGTDLFYSTVNLNSGTLDLTTSGSGSWNLGGIAGSSNTTIRLRSGSTLSAGTNNTDTSFGGDIDLGNGVFYKAGTGELSLSGRILSGQAFINSGSVTLENNYSFLDTAVSVYGQGQLQFGQITQANIAALSSNRDISLTNEAGNAVALNIYGFYLFESDDTISGVLSGLGSLTKAGDDILTLSGANTFTGATTASGGTLHLANTNALQASTLNLNGGTTDFVGITSANLGGLTGAGNLALTNTGNGAVAVSVGANNASTTHSGVLSGTGSLIKTGTGTLTLSGNNTYTGATTVSQGILQIASTNALQSSTANLNGGTLTYSGITSANFGGLAGSGDLALTNTDTAAVALTVGANNESTTYSGVLSGAGSLTKAGTGSLTLSGSNTYSGGTTVSGGTLTGNTTSLQGDIANNAAVVFDQASTGTYAGNLSGTGSLTKTGAGALTLSGNNTYTGGTTISGGTLQIGAGAALAGGITNNSTVVFDRSDDYAFNNVISGNGDLTKTGTGTLYLNAANTYTGATNINAGTLRLGEGLSLASTSINVASGASFYVDADSGFTLGSNQTLGGTGSVTGGTLTLGSGATLAPGNSPGTLTFTSGLTLDAGAVLNFELGTTSDLVVVSGGTLTGPSSGTVTFNLANSGGFAAGTYTLFDYTSATLSDFDTTDFTLGTQISGYDYSFSLTDTALQLIAVTSAVPEPSTWAIIFGVSALGLAVWRKRRGAKA